MTDQQDEPKVIKIKLVYAGSIVSGDKRYFRYYRTDGEGALLGEPSYQRRQLAAGRPGIIYRASVTLSDAGELQNLHGRVLWDSWWPVEEDVLKWQLATDTTAAVMRAKKKSETNVVHAQMDPVREMYQSLRSGPERAAFLANLLEYITR